MNKIIEYKLRKLTAFADMALAKEIYTTRGCLWIGG